MSKNTEDARSKWTATVNEPAASLPLTAEQFWQEWWPTRMDLQFSSAKDNAIAFAEAYADSQTRAVRDAKNHEIAMLNIELLRFQTEAAELRKRVQALTEGLNKALEWAAKYPLQGTASEADSEAAKQIYVELSQLLGNK